MKTKIFAVCTAVALSAALFAGCGKDEVKTADDSNIVPITQDGGEETAQTPTGEKKYEVKLDERTEETRYAYSLEDLSFIDTVTGQRLSIGMTMEAAEKITGPSFTDDNAYRIYDGLIVQYTEEQKVAALIVSSGLFPDQNQGTRFMSNRGVGLGTSFEDCAKAYGELSNEGSTTKDDNGEVIARNMSNMVRYFTVDGDKVEYLGTELTPEMESKYAGKIYLQDFMFDHATNAVSVMRVINIDYIGG